MRRLIVIMIRYMDGHVPWVLWGAYQRWRDRFIDRICDSKKLVHTCYTAACPECDGRPLRVRLDGVEECRYCDGEGKITHYIDRYEYTVAGHKFFSFNGYITGEVEDAIHVERVKSGDCTFACNLVICAILSLYGEVNFVKAVRMLLNAKN